MEQQTHWKKLKNNDYLGAYILEPNKDMIVTIKDVKKGEIVGEDGKKSEGTLLYFKEQSKPMILNTTNAKAISTIYDTPYVENWIGKQVQLYSMKIRAFGENLEALRIRKWIPCICSECKGKIEAFNNLTAEQLAVYTTSKYKHPLCSNCASKMKEGN